MSADLATEPAPDTPSDPDPVAAPYVCGDAEGPGGSEPRLALHWHLRCDEDAIANRVFSLEEGRCTATGGASCSTRTTRDRARGPARPRAAPATRGGRAIDVDALRPGTVVIDDSFPRAFDDDAAQVRMRTCRDVLCLGGGMLDAGPLERSSPFPGADAIRRRYPTRWLPGCTPRR